MRKRFSKEGFEKMYLQEKLTLEQISEKTGVPYATIGRWKDDWDVPTLERTPKVGKRFGRLLVLEESRSKKRGIGTQCRCHCDCGKEVFIRWGNLQRGLVNSCGCFRLEQISLPLGEAMRKSLISEYKRTAKKKNNVWSLTDQEAIILFRSNCFYCGKSPSAVKKAVRCNGSFVYNGIDRVDNLQGYVSSNVVACCKHCNYAKSNSTQKDFLDRILRIQEPVKNWGLEIVKEIPQEKRLAMCYLYATYRTNAHSRNLIFELSKEQCFTLFQEPCAYCGELTSNKREGFLYNGIDRVDNNMGYLWSNCVPCCRSCNRMKNSSSLSDLLSWVALIKNKQAGLQVTPPVIAKE